MNPTRRALCILIAAAALPCSAAPDWPSKPVTLVVPGGPGGVVDIRSRWLAPRLSAQIGQPVIVENRPGAGGNVGTASAARSAPDGYTFVMTHQGIMSVNPHIEANLGFVPARDFIPVAALGRGTLALVVNNKLPVHSVADLVALARTRSLNYGSPGMGSPPHLAAELFKQLAHVEAVHVPYKGGGQAASDLMGGHVDFSIEGLTVMEPLIREGRVRVLAVSGPKRVSVLPDVPTMAEAGVTGYAYEGWTGILAPTGTPKAIVERVNQIVTAVLETPEGREFLLRSGIRATPETPEAFAAFLREDYERMGRVVRTAGIKGE